MRRMILPLILFAGVACQPGRTEMTDAQRTAIRDTIGQIMDGLVHAARALDAGPIRATYAENPVAVLNGVIIEDFDAQFELTKQFLGSLQALDGSYDNVYVDVLAPDAVVVTRNDHLSWTDTTGTPGEWHSAWTGIFRRIGSEWKIIYAHESTVPPEVR